MKKYSTSWSVAQIKDLDFFSYELRGLLDVSDWKTLFGRIMHLSIPTVTAKVGTYSNTALWPTNKYELLRFLCLCLLAAFTEDNVKNVNLYESFLYTEVKPVSYSFSNKWFKNITGHQIIEGDMELSLYNGDITLHDLNEEEYLVIYSVLYTLFNTRTPFDFFYSTLYNLRKEPKYHIEGYYEVL